MLDSKISVYIPNYNGAEFLRSVNIPPGLDCVIMDNASTDNSVTVCKDRGFTVIQNSFTVSRVDNWIRCIEHFKNSEYDWLKWLFIGDELSPESGEMIRDAIEKNRDASLIVFEYDICSSKRKIRWKSQSSYSRHHTNAEIKEDIIHYGNIFGSPIGICLSRKAANAKLDLMELQWAADLWMCYTMSKEGYTAFYEGCVGAFNEKNRKCYSKNSSEISSYLEMLEVTRRVYIELKDEQILKEDCRKNFMTTMRKCLEHNSKSFSEILQMQLSVFKAISHKILNKVGR